MNKFEAGLIGCTALAAFGSLINQANATNPVPVNPQTCQIPAACVDINANMGGLPGITLTYNAVNAVTTTPQGAMLVPRSITLDTFSGTESAGSGGTFTCAASAVIQLMTSSSTNFASAVSIGAITFVSTYTSVVLTGTFTTTIIPANTYVGFEAASGSCTSAQLSAIVLGH